LLRIALLLLSIPLLAHGGDGIYETVRNRQMTTVTCPEFMRSPPTARWLRVIGCEIDYTHPAITASGDHVTEMYFGMRTRNERRDAPVSLIVATRDPQALAVAQQALANGAEITDETFTIAMLRVVGILRAAREVDGYARNGIVERLITRRALAEFDAPLTSHVIVLDLHAGPSVLTPGIEAGAGLVLLLTGAALRRRRQPVAVAEPAPDAVAESAPEAVAVTAVEPPVEPPEAARGVTEVSTAAGEAPLEISEALSVALDGPPVAAPPPEAPAWSDTPPVILERQLPPAMLLNLEPSASVNEIEYAPPLGNQQEVAARISSVLGPLASEGNGKYSVGGKGWLLAFDLGRDDSVWTAAVDVRGSEAGLDALDRLARETTWRVFVPRLGTFR
jgi:hypothetical protein